MKVALSPCPNDIFIFSAWIQGFVGQDFPIEPVFADIEQLNTWALNNTFSFTKLSFPCFAKVSNSFQLLSSGAALGFNCGPKLIAPHFFPLNELCHKCIAIPGKETTAHFLIQRLLETPKKKIFCPYNEILFSLQNNQADCGVIIHETRFTYAQQGFKEIVDLGILWQEKTGLPLPLGGVAISRELSQFEKNKILSTIQDSLNYAHTHSSQIYPFILEHSQEKDLKVIQQHIDTYVNQETEQLSDQGMHAIQSLLNHTLPEDWIYF